MDGGDGIRRMLAVEQYFEMADLRTSDYFTTTVYNDLVLTHTQRSLTG
jgi:hypothetical protein